MEKKIVCVSCDSEKCEIDEVSSKRSELLTQIFTDFKENMEETQLSEINGMILKKVFEYLIHYREEEPKELPKPLPSENLAEVASEWDMQFVNSIPLDDVFDLINAANFFSIRPLLELSCAKIAAEMYGKTAEEIRQKFDIENDLDENDLKEYEQFKI